MKKDYGERRNIIGPAVRKLRKRKDWTQKDLSQMLRDVGWKKCTRGWLSRIESGAYCGTLIFRTSMLYGVTSLIWSLEYSSFEKQKRANQISQESQMLMELTRTGEIVGSLDLSTLGLPKGDTIEGVTMDDAGIIYLTAEGGSKCLPSHLYVLNAVHEPSTYVLVGLGVLGVWAFVRRQRKSNA